MNTFQTKHRVNHSAEDMFKLVSAVEDYPDFLPLCDALTVRSAEQTGEKRILVADMTVAYKFLRETFTTRVTLDPEANFVTAEYLDGPFRHLENKWRFVPVSDQECEVDFFISYEFRSKALQLLAGTVFDKAFRKFTQAFEDRADQVYGQNNAMAHRV